VLLDRVNTIHRVVSKQKRSSGEKKSLLVWFLKKGI